MVANTPQTQVTHACGHSAMRVKSQHDTLMEIRIRTARRTLCEACLTAHKAKRDCMVSNSVQRTKEAAAATKLIGSKKQIEWASRIREKWLYIVKRELPTQVLFSFDKVRGADVSPEAIEQAATTVLAVRLAAIDDVVTHSQAAWWIDFRDHLESMVNRLTDVAIKSECSALLNK